MRAQFFDRQDDGNPLNGVALEDSEALRKIVQTMQARAPFMAELVGTNGRTLLLGLGSSDGCVQFSSTDGEPPYLMALRPNAEAEGEQEFLIGGTPSPVPRRYCLSMPKVADIAATFLENGERYPGVEWEEI
jgi:hypothetical protein